MADDSRRVLTAVQRLPGKQRAALVLRHIEGMTLREIAAGEVTFDNLEELGTEVIEELETAEESTRYDD